MLDLMLRYAGGDCNEGECAQLERLLANSETARQEMCDLALEAIAVSEQQGDVVTVARRSESSSKMPVLESQAMKAADACGSPLNERRSRGWRWPVSVAVALAVVAMLGFAYFMPKSDLEIVRVTDVAGAVRWTGNGGAVVDELSEDAVLMGGVVETRSDDASVTLAFRDGSRITLVGESKATLSELDRQKKVHLGTGSLSADIQRQPDGKPFLIETPTAVLEVVGTRFDVDSVETLTLLAVSEGAVRLTRRVDGSVVEVPADHQAVASLSPEDEFQPQQRAEFSHAWASSLDAMPMGAEGQWFPATADSAARLRAVPSVSMRKNGQPRAVHRVKLRINGNTPRPLQLQAGTSVRIRGRLAKPSRVVCLLGTGGPQGGFAGNYFYAESPTDHEHWVIEFKLSQLEPQRAGHVAATPNGLVLNCVILYTRGADSGLEIEGVEVIGSDDSQATSFNGEPQATGVVQNEN